MPEIALVTDSTADLPAELVQAHQIRVVPNFLILDGESLEDGIAISRQEFYTRLPALKTPATTATPSSGVYQHIYEELFQAGAKTILSLHAPSRLSGIFNAARLAASAFGDRVRVLDGGQLSMGTGFQVLAMAEAIQSGATVEEILAMLEDLQTRITVVAMLDTLEYVRRSGRVSWARARLGELLQVKPFVEVKDGQVFSRGEARTRRKGIERLKEFLAKNQPLERLAILHTNAEQDARQFAAELPYSLDETPMVINITPVIGTHVGPNGLGFAVVAKNHV
jgi:DegV family protein with EDD domain